MHPRCTLIFSFALICSPFVRADELIPDKIEFNRTSGDSLEHCFKCHGFDPKAREAERRLDIREGALADNGGVRAIVPGNLAESDAWLRISSKDRDEIMPPPKSGKTLTARQIAILKRWIEQGAEYQAHWSYAALQRPAAPQIAAALRRSATRSTPSFRRGSPDRPGPSTESIGRR